MKTSKRPWTRGEKLLFLTPLLIALVAFGSWWWQRTSPLTIAVKDVREIAFSPDGKRILISTRRPRYVYANSAAIYDTQTGSFETRLQIPAVTTSLENLTWSPDGSRVAAGTTHFIKGPLSYQRLGKIDRNTLSSGTIWNAATGTQILTFPYAPPTEYMWSYLDWARDGKLWGIGLPPALFDVHTGKRTRRFGAPIVPPLLQSSVFNEKHTLLAINTQRGARPGKILIYEVPGGRLLRTFKTPEPVNVMRGRGDILALHQESKWKPGTLRSGTVKIVDARTGREFFTPRVSYVDSLSFGLEGQVVLIDGKWRVKSQQGSMESEASRLVMWDYRAGKMLWQLQKTQKNEGRFNNVSISPDGRLISAVEWNKKPVRVVWNSQTGAEIWRHRIERQSMKWAPDSKRIAIYADWGSNDVEIWRVED